MTKEDFRHIYNQYGKAIRNYIYYRSGDTAIADDITQETFVRIWEKKFKYNPTKTKSLLYKISNQLFLDHIRKNKIETEYIELFKLKLKEDIEQTEENDILRKKCEKAMSLLSEKERTVFLLSRKDELKYSEIAECLNISIKAVEKRMSQALKKLKLTQLKQL